MIVHRHGILMALAALAFTFVMTAGALADELEDGKAAYGAGKYEEAFGLLFPLAHEGEVAAQSLVGTMFKEGQGQAVNLEQARKWFHLAAEQGDALSQYNLAVMMYNGEGGPPDDLGAYKWMLLSYKGGNKLAGHRLTHTGSKLSRAERAQIKQETDDWKPGEKRPVPGDGEEAPPKKERKLFVD